MTPRESLQRGDAVPHFEVRTLDGEPRSYSTLWQRKHLVLVALPASDSDYAGKYVSELTARRSEFSSYDAECLATSGRIPGIPSPGVVIADRWGEIAYIAATEHIADLPPTQELLDWIKYVQMQCPECEGESK